MNKDTDMTMQDKLRMADDPPGTNAGFNDSVAYRLDQLEAKLAQQQAILESICAYPLCECGTSECRVLDTPIPGKTARDQLEADKAELWKALHNMRGLTLGRSIFASVAIRSADEALAKHKDQS